MTPQGGHTVTACWMLGAIAGAISPGTGGTEKEPADGADGSELSCRSLRGG